MALAVVLLFVLMISTYLFYMVFMKSGTKKQNLATHSQKKAYYMAMGAVQQALLKLRLMPRIAYDAGSLAKGVCPFFNPYGSKLVKFQPNNPNKCSKAMEIFISDLNSKKLPPLLFALPDYPIPQDTQFPWRFEVTKFTVSTHYTSTDTKDIGTIREVAHIEALGFAYDARDSNIERTEYVSKDVELKRRIK